MKTILVVDDEDRIRRIYQDVLNRDGFNVMAAQTASEAKRLLVTHDIDLVLLDINMAEVSGDVLFEVIEAFHRGTKVIVSSVYPLDEQKQKIKDAVDYYDKSEGIGSLLNKVHKHLPPEDARKNVVVIDDEARVRILLCRLLKENGYHAISFSDNKAALNYLKGWEGRIDLFILDLAMPQIDGCYFFEMIKMKHPDTKTMIVSNYSVDTQQNYIFDADAYFDKCDGNDEFVRQVNRLMAEPILG